MSGIEIIKENGEVEEFDQDKLRSSLLRSNASIILAEEIVEKIEKDLKPKTRTKEIYKKAFNLLKKREKSSALRYSIRRSLLGLGPSGFPFEKFIEKIFKKKGYQAKVGVILQGQCVEHEIDVIALTKDGELFLTEIKFHNDLYLKSDTKVVLYIKARFDDLKNTTVDIFSKKLNPTRMLVITNTKFTENAVKYGLCAGLDLISWDFPTNGNLYSLVYETDTYPITILESINNSEKVSLLSEGVITCDDLLNSKWLSRFDQNKKAKIREEVETINNK